MGLSQTLDALLLPLQGERLIEASAGTGKTFTITTLYMRLLLGLDTLRRPPLPVDQILVVTFTEAATQSLRERIRGQMRALHYCCLHGPGTEPTLNDLLALIDNPQVAAEQLLAAERQLDEAAIMTIHSFCYRMLAYYAVEAGVPLAQELLPQDQHLKQQAVADFWRRHFYTLPIDVARIIQQLWPAGPEALFHDLSPYLHGDLPVLLCHTQDETVQQRHQAILAKIEATKISWKDYGQQVSTLINSSGISKQRYPARYLQRWLDQIDNWANQQTVDYTLPNALTRFCQTALTHATLRGQPPCHPLFEQIEQLYAQPMTLRDLVMAQALPLVRAEIAMAKQQHAVLCFDDLLAQLDQVLQSERGPDLAVTIHQRYPAALIDEFQDTDPVQYRIFSALYQGHPETLLLLIGDPKQAIYGFRGADIFTYIQARRTIQHHYTLETNWRSSAALISAVNQLFSHATAPFIFEQDIPFLPIKVPPKAAHYHFKLQGETQAALQCHHLTSSDLNEGITPTHYREQMAHCCAAHVSHWINAGIHHQALLEQSSITRPVSAGDIAILVRTGDEAHCIRQALNAVGIPSVYLSNRHSVFSTPDAIELLRLLQAVLNPTQEQLLRTALAGTLFALDAAALEQLNQDDLGWEQVVNEFLGYQQQWRQRGVLSMLHQLLQRRKLAEQLLATPEGERRLTDLRHLGELLQSTAQQLESETALVHWLERQIAHPECDVNSQQLRLESDSHLVKIITIHKSKGLEYPLVWVPFACTWRIAQRSLYHHRQTHLATLDLRDQETSRQLADQERLAEDLRLLYVALTRAIFHCSLGIAPLISGQRKSKGTTDLHYSALGYLLQQGEAGDAQRLQSALTTLQSAEIALRSATDLPTVQPFTPATSHCHLAARQFNRTLHHHWHMTSYSGLQQHALPTAIAAGLPRWDLDAVDTIAPTLGAHENYSMHHFPRGAGAGTFLHTLLQSIDFNAPLSHAWLREQSEQQGFDTQWLPVLQQWLPAILQTPLHPQQLSLHQLAPHQRQAEMQFYLPIDGLLQADRLEQLMRRYDPLSQQAVKKLKFEQIKGMLQGFIDLVFEWQGGYYLLDYKSNWLGETPAAYHPEALRTAMCQHRYDLQYQLYTLALHRYLKHRLPNYHYSSHFGGIFYLFLRGMSGQPGGNGIFFHRPDYTLINTLDHWFADTAPIHTVVEPNAC